MLGRLIAGLSILCLLVLAGTARGQQRPVTLDTVQVVGTRLASGLAMGTRAVEVLTRERLESWPVRTVAQALKWALGVDVMDRSPAQSDLSIRGASFEQVLVLLDGVPMSDAQTGHFDLDLAIPFDQVERIEVLRGPGSALYGTDAMGGVVNIVTRTPAPRAEGRIEGGSFGTLVGSLGGGVRVGETGLAGGVSLSRSEGHRDGTDYRVGEAHVSARSSLWGGEVTARAGQAWRNFGAAEFYAPFPSFERTRTSSGAVVWRGPLSGRLTLEPRLHLRRRSDDFVLDRADPAFYRNQHVSSQIGAEAVVRYRGAGGVSLAGGAGLGRDILASSNLGDRTENRWALFGEAAGVWGPLALDLGARADRYQSYGSFLSPSFSAALLYHPLRLRGSLGRSFRAPSWTERFYQDPNNRGRADLDREHGWTVELGADLNLVKQLWLATTVFRRRAVDLIDWARPDNSADVPWETRNVESATFWGLEAELSGLQVAGTRIGVQGNLLSLSAADATGFVSKYALRPFVRDLSVTAGRPIGPLLAETRLRYRRRDDEIGHWLLDLRVALPMRYGEAYFDVLNGLDDEYADITGAPAAGISVMVGFRVRR